MESEDGQKIQSHGLSLGQPSALVSTPPPGLAPTDRPPPGLQRHLNQNTVAPLGTLQGNKPPGLSLGSLASEHLKTQPPLGLENLMPGSLSALSLNQQSPTRDNPGGRMKEPLGYPSLGSLASNHLQGGELAPSLASLTVSPSSGLIPNGEQSLGSLAANHLSGLKNPAGSSPSLGSLAASHLSATSQPASSSLSNSGHSSSQDNTSNTSSLSTGSLASSHLQAGSKSSLGSLASNHLSAMPTSLGSLAAVHLSNANSSLGSLSSKYPEKKSSDISESELVTVVDLTSALKPNSLGPEMPVPVLKKKEQVHMKEKVNVSLLVHDLSTAPRSLQKRCASSFGRVVSRKWRRLEHRQPLKINLPGYQHLPAFVFDTPSPDDIVKSAQAQSRAFRPPTTAS